MINFVWDLAQQRQILNTKHSAAEASRTAKSADQRIAELEQSFDRLTLITRALWEIVQQYHPIDDGYLAGKIQEIDLRDGRLDGKLDTKRLQTCKHCGKVLNKKHLRCIYCGNPDLQTDSFDKIK